MLLKPNKLNSNILKVETYLHSLLAYIVNHSVRDSGEPSTVEEYVEWCKVFANECRERFVDSNHAVIPRQHNILDTAPKAVLAQLSTWMKALPAPFSTELDLDKWKDTFAPPPESLAKQVDSADKGVRAIENMFRVSTYVEQPVNHAWVKQHGCLELNANLGGTLAMLAARIPSDITAFLSYAKPLDRLDMLQRVWSQLWDACIQDVAEYAHPCSPSCQRERHMPILHTLVSSLGWKNRHLSMNYSALQYLASILQKPFTEWLRNMPATAEGIDPKCNFISAIDSAYRQIAGWKLGRGLYILSGDLSGCTNHFIPVVSQAAAKKAVTHVNGRLSPAENMIIETSLGRYDIFFQSPQVDEMRRSDPVSATYALSDLEGSDAFRLKQTIGQHMSSSLSFPVMGTMHQSIYDHLSPKRDKRFTNPLVRQLFRRIAQGNGEAVYVFGVTNSGKCWYLSKGLTKHLPQNQHLAMQARVLYDLTRTYLEKFDKTLKKLGMKALFTFEWISKFPMPQESELGNVEYKAPGYRDGLPSPLPMFSIGRDTMSEVSFRKKMTPGPAALKVTIKLPQNAADIVPTLYIADSMLLRNQLPSRFYPDGEYAVESMCFQTSVIITQGVISWAPKIQPTLRMIYLWSVGDDHLVLSQSHEFIRAYQDTTQRYFNQEYNRKANYVSSTGVLIAERLGRVDPRNQRIIAVPYIKVKQLVVPRAYGAGSSWMERSTSIRTQMLAEYRHKSGVLPNFLYRMIQNAEKILYWNNQSDIDWFISNSIDPRLPKQLGGYEISPTNRQDINLVTWRHLVNLTYLRNHYADYLPKYVKHIRAAANRFRNKKTDTREIKLYKEGPYFVARKDYKEFLYMRFGFIAMLQSSSQVEEVSSRAVAQDLNGEVNMVYSQLFPAWYTVQTALERAKGELPTLETCFELRILGPQVPDSPNDILKYVDLDPRTLGISYADLEFYSTALQMEERITKNLSESRVGNAGASLGFKTEDLAPQFKRFALERHLDDLEKTAGLNLTWEEKCKSPEPKQVKYEYLPNIAPKKPGFKIEPSLEGNTISAREALVIQDYLRNTSILKLRENSSFHSENWFV